MVWGLRLWGAAGCRCGTVALAPVIAMLLHHALGRIEFVKCLLCHDEMSDCGEAGIPASASSGYSVSSVRRLRQVKGTIGLHMPRTELALFSLPVYTTLLDHYPEAREHSAIRPPPSFSSPEIFTAAPPMQPQSWRSNCRQNLPCIM
ncbi:hypothetical protein B0J12DRAFT_405812 [Macrophomina phaseolina]|uniref:Secreted protein n=1 Tax=Macrophomina phaseolina TaxID=35725 RepID=A0ABQ8GIY9_9PEZI|nr:hypothetical protein B0J12DRAFT_405812 [Macrophomina phaseolina]